MLATKHHTATCLLSLPREMGKRFRRVKVGKLAG